MKSTYTLGTVVLKGFFYVELFMLTLKCIKFTYLTIIYNSNLIVHNIIMFNLLKNISKKTQKMLFSLVFKTTI